MKFLTLVLAILIMVALRVFFITLGWNLFVASLFGAQELTIPQALGFMLLFPGSASFKGAKND